MRYRKTKTNRCDFNSWSVEDFVHSSIWIENPRVPGDGGQSTFDTPIYRNFDIGYQVYRKFDISNIFIPYPTLRNAIYPSKLEAHPTFSRPFSLELRTTSK